MGTEQIASKKQVEQYYDDYIPHQKKIGLNIRHRTIFKNTLDAGLRRNSKVLEVGCGIGSLSSLIIKYVNKGDFLGVDISHDSIELANKIFKNINNANFIVSDMTDFHYGARFNFVIFPDVLEHIPITQHENLFKIISEHTTEDGVILINIPEPNFLDWIRLNKPQDLQIIDQSLSLQDLVNHLYKHGFKLHLVKPYSLNYNVNDYVNLVFKRQMKIHSAVQKSFIKRSVQNQLSKLMNLRYF